MTTPGNQRVGGKVALVTGASRGIGEGIAERLAAEGARVAVTARTVEPGQSRLPGSLTETVERIRAAGGEAVAVPADLAVRDDRVRLVAEAEEALGPIDILVNNAAVSFFAPVVDFSDKRLDLMIEVLVKAPIHLSQLVVPGMSQRKQGWILNISTRVARHPQGPPYHGGTPTIYGMCKAALERFTTGLAAEVHADGIAVNCLSPSNTVLTPGVAVHRNLVPAVAEGDEPVSVMAGAALALVTGDPATLTGRITYSQEVGQGAKANA